MLRRWHAKCTSYATLPHQRAFRVTPGSTGRVSDGFLRPAACGRDHHSDAWHRHQVAPSGKPGVGTRRGLAGDPEPLGQLITGRHRVTGRPLPGPDLSLDDPRDLEVTRDTLQVIKIIRHTGHPS